MFAIIGTNVHQQLREHMTCVLNGGKRLQRNSTEDGQFVHMFNVCVGKLGLAQGNGGQYSH